MRRILLACLCSITLFSWVNVTAKNARFTVVYDEDAELSPRNYSLGKNIAVPLYLVSLFSEQVTPILLNGKLAQAVLYAYSLQKESLSAGLVDERTVQEICIKSPEKIQSSIDGAWRVIVNKKDSSLFDTIRSLKQLSVIDQGLQSTACSDSTIKKSEYADRQGFSMLFDLAKSLSWNDWDIYTITSTARFVLFIPKKYSATMMRAGLSMSDALGLNLNDETLCKKITGVSAAPVLGDQKLDQSGEIVKIFEKLFKKKQQVDSLSWNFFFFGHGMYRADAKSAAATELLRGGDSASAIAGMPTATFLKVLDFISTLDTNIVIWSTCYGGGYHAQAVAQLASIASWQFVALSIATTDAITLAMQGIRAGSFFDGLDKIFSQISDKRATEQDLSKLYQQVIPEFGQVVQYITKEKPIIYFPGSAGFQPVGQHDDDFNITTETLKEKNIVSVPLTTKNILVYVNDVTVPLMIKKMPSSIRAMVGGNSQTTFATCDASSLNAYDFFKTFFDQSIKLSAVEKTSRGTGIVYTRTFTFDSLKVQWKWKASNTAFFDTRREGEVVELENVLVVVYPEQSIPLGGVAFTVKNSAGKIFMYELDLWPAIIAGKVKNLVARKQEVPDLMVQARKRFLDILAIVTAMQKGDTVTLNSLIATADQRMLAAALFQAIVYQDVPLVKELIARVQVDGGVRQYLMKSLPIFCKQCQPIFDQQLKKTGATFVQQSISAVDIVQMLKNKDPKLDKLLSNAQAPALQDALRVVVHDQDTVAMRTLLKSDKWRLADMAKVIDGLLLDAVKHGDSAVVRVLVDAAPVKNLDAYCDALYAAFKNTKLSKGDLIAIRDVLIKQFKTFECVHVLNILLDPVILRSLFILEPFIEKFPASYLASITSKEIFTWTGSLTLADKKALLEYAELLLNEVQKRLSVGTVIDKKKLTEASEKLSEKIVYLKRLISQAKPQKSTASAVADTLAKITAQEMLQASVSDLKKVDKTVLDGWVNKRHDDASELLQAFLYRIMREKIENKAVRKLALQKLYTFKDNFSSKQQRTFDKLVSDYNADTPSDKLIYAPLHKDSATPVVPPPSPAPVIKKSITPPAPVVVQPKSPKVTTSDKQADMRFAF